MDTSDPLEAGSYSGKLTSFSCDIHMDTKFRSIWLVLLYQAILTPLLAF